jgi:thiamine kinase-like enzyme
MLHQNSRAMHKDERAELADLTFFRELRLDPYFEYLKPKYPEIADVISLLIDELENGKKAFVHGDFSPKNMLTGASQRLIVLDFEVAHWGNPVFDLAFCLAHFLLKGWHLKRKADALSLVAAFFQGYRSDPGNLLPHLGLMLLARVDGKSPVEYLIDSSVKQQIRETVLPWIKLKRASDSLFRLESDYGGDLT